MLKKKTKNSSDIPAPFVANRNQRNKTVASSTSVSQNENVSLDDIYEEYLTKTIRFDKRKFANYVRMYHGNSFKYCQIQIYLNDKAKQEAQESLQPQQTNEKIPTKISKTHEKSIATHEILQPSNLLNLTKTQTSNTTKKHDHKHATQLPTMEKKLESSNHIKKHHKKSTKHGSKHHKEGKSVTMDINQFMIHNHSKQESKEFESKIDGINGEKSGLETNRLQANETHNDIKYPNENETIMNGNSFESNKTSSNKTETPSWVKSRPKLKKHRKHRSYWIEINVIDKDHIGTETNKSGENTNKIASNTSNATFQIKVDSNKIKNYSMFNLQSDIIKNKYMKDASYVNLQLRDKNGCLCKMNDLVIEYAKHKGSNVIPLNASIVNIKRTRRGSRQFSRSQWF